MKWLKVFSVFIILHGVLWICSHLYRTANPTEVLIGVDTSFGMKEQHLAMQGWIEDYEADARYESITIATDKKLIGPLNEIVSRESIFRSAFGPGDAADFEKYDAVSADKRLLLSDGRFVMQGWELISFQ